MTANVNGVAFATLGQRETWLGLMGTHRARPIDVYDFMRGPNQALHLVQQNTAPALTNSSSLW